MTVTSESITPWNSPDYEYGNFSAIGVIRLAPNLGGTALHPFDSLDHPHHGSELFNEKQLESQVREIAENYRVIGDPKSTETNPKQFGITVANNIHLRAGIPAILTMSTSGSSLYHKKGNPNNEGNALELAYTALKNPDWPIVYVESPGNGNSVDLDDDEYRQAAQDGRLVHAVQTESGKLLAYEAFDTLQALSRALAEANIRVSHISSNATGAHFSTALMAALPKNTVERAFLYNPSNISDRNILGLTFGQLREILSQGKYKNASKDPLVLTEERKAMAVKVMRSNPKRKIDQVRASTHNPRKLARQQKIFRRGNLSGQSAAIQSVVSQAQHQELKQTFVFPEFASQYKGPEDFQEFMKRVATLGGRIVEIADLESLKIPFGQYGHSHYPTVRQTLEDYAFNR